MRTKSHEQIQFAVQHGFRPDARPEIHRYEAVLSAPDGSVYRVEVYFDTVYAGTPHEVRDRRPQRGERCWYVSEGASSLPFDRRQRWFSRAEGGARGAWKYAVGVVRGLVATGYVLKDPAPVEGAEMEAR